MLNLFLMILFGISSSLATSRDEAFSILELHRPVHSLHNRLDAFSKMFIGLPYGKGGPLGEGPEGKYDQDPLYRFDTFDCTTYVETIMALALSNDVEEFEKKLNLIRYKNGIVDYMTRNHFTDLQWIPENIHNGLLNEINEDVVSFTEIKLAQALINFSGWILSHKIEQIVVPFATTSEKEKLLQELKAEAPHYPSQMASVPYISIDLILDRPEIINRIPSGSLVNFVRPNWDLTQVAGTHQNISHQGFLFKVNNLLYLRHASTTGKVEQVPFIDYLKKFRNHETLKGIHLMSMN